MLLAQYASGNLKYLILVDGTDNEIKEIVLDGWKWRL